MSLVNEKHSMYAIQRIGYMKIMFQFGKLGSVVLYSINQ
jgi:hypothetical protein